MSRGCQEIYIKCRGYWGGEEGIFPHLHNATHKIHNKRLLKDKCMYIIGIVQQYNSKNLDTTILGCSKS